MAEVALEWQTLSELSRSAPLSVEQFRAQFTGPFLLEVNPESEVVTGETRSFDPSKLASTPAAPTLASSLIVFLGASEQILLGRGEGCHLRSTHGSVSEKHCMFERVGPMWSIRDAGSKNGTFLNGRQLGPTEQLPIKLGTKLGLGEAQFLFMGQDDCFDLLQELTKEPRIRPRSLGKFKTDFKAAGTPEKLRAEFPGPFLVVQAPAGGASDAGSAGGGGPVSSNTVTLSREELGKQQNRTTADAIFDLSRHSLVRVGRATITQIHLPLGAISNLHAALVKDEDRWFVQDLGAKNGTYVWGEKLEGRRELESGNEIMLGNIRAIFFNTPDFITYAANRDIAG